MKTDNMKTEWLECRPRLSVKASRVLSVNFHPSVDWYPTEIVLSGGSVMSNLPDAVALAIQKDFENNYGSHFVTGYIVEINEIQEYLTTSELDKKYII